MLIPRRVSREPCLFSFLVGATKVTMTALVAFVFGRCSPRIVVASRNRVRVLVTGCAHDGIDHLQDDRKRGNRGSAAR